MALDQVRKFPIEINVVIVFIIQFFTIRSLSRNGLGSVRTKRKRSDMVLDSI